MNFCAVGTGSITKWMLSEFARSSVLHCTAICSRSEEKGRAMADAFGIDKVYTSMEEMLQDPSIELVYVASPNSVHYAQTKACQEAGKHVICEKPFTPTPAEAEELVAWPGKSPCFSSKPLLRPTVPIILRSAQESRNWAN